MTTTTDLANEIMARAQSDVGAVLGRIGADLETRGLSDDEKMRATLAMASMLLSMATGRAELALGKDGANAWLLSVVRSRVMRERAETMN